MKFQSFTVVENSGHDQERDIKEFADYYCAVRHKYKVYTVDEQSDLHVRIRGNYPDGTGSYEVG